MQRFLLLGLLCCTLSFLGCQPAEAPAEEAVAEGAPETGRGTAEIAIDGTQISVNYGRPELKDRDMLARLEDGQVWRLGMNEAASFETSADLTFGDSVIQAGKYSIWAIPISMINY